MMTLALIGAWGGNREMFSAPGTGDTSGSCARPMWEAHTLEQMGHTWSDAVVVVVVQSVQLPCGVIW